MVSLSIPAILGMIVIGLYNFMDAVFVGKMAGPEAMTAIKVSYVSLLFVCFDRHFIMFHKPVSEGGRFQYNSVSAEPLEIVLKLQFRPVKVIQISILR